VSFSRQSTLRDADATSSRGSRCLSRGAFGVPLEAYFEDSGHPLGGLDGPAAHPGVPIQSYQNINFLSLAASCQECLIYVLPLTASPHYKYRCGTLKAITLQTIGAHAICRGIGTPGSSIPMRNSSKLVYGSPVKSRGMPRTLSASNLGASNADLFEI
jgi:hypothetical protein